MDADEPREAPSALLDRRRCVVFAIDLQERLGPAIDGIGPVVANAARLFDAAAHLAVPLCVTEQYPKGLGPTVASLRQKPITQLLEKTAFGALREPDIAAAASAWREEGRDCAVIFGTETHVCVLQTAMLLLASGWRVALVADACGSRFARDKQAGLDRLARAGAEVLTTEMVLFEWLERANTDEFRTLLPLIRDGS